MSDVLFGYKLKLLLLINSQTDNKSYLELFKKSWEFCQDSEQAILLRIAIENGTFSEELLKDCIQKGFDLNLLYNIFGPIYSEDDKSFILMDLKGKKQIIYTSTYKKQTGTPTPWTILHYCAFYQKINFLSILLKNGATPDIEDYAETTPMQLVRKYDLLQTILMQEYVNTTVNQHITCDDCKKGRFVGKRYVCKTKENYDLCQNCYAKRSLDDRIRHRYCEVKSSIEDANKYFKEGNYKEAYVLFFNLISENPSYDAYYKYGYCAYQLQFYQVALEASYKALNIRLTIESVLLKTRSMAKLKYSYKLIGKEVEWALEQDPNNSEFLKIKSSMEQNILNNSIQFFESNNLDEAIKTLIDGIDALPSSKLIKDKLEKYKKHLDDRIKLEEIEMKIDKIRQLATLFYDQKNIVQAIKILKEGIETYPKSETLRDYLSILQTELKEAEKKEKEEKENNQISMLIEHGNECFRQKKWNDALVFYNQALTLKPKKDDESKAYANRALTFFELKKYEECLKDCEVCQTLGNYKGYVIKCKVKYEQNLLDEAIECTKNALEKYPNDPMLKGYLENYEKEKKEIREMIQREKEENLKRKNEEKLKRENEERLQREIEEKLKTEKEKREMEVKLKKEKEEKERIEKEKKDLEDQIRKEKQDLEKREKEKKESFDKWIKKEYFNVEEIGKGSFGKIYKGKKNGKSVAIKKITFKTSEDFNRILKEISLLSMLKHENILSIITQNGDPSNNWIALITELYDMDLNTFIWNSQKKEQMSNELIYDISYRIILGIEYIHSKGIIHRDLKPENVLISFNPTKLAIADFGLSKSSDNAKSLTGSVNFIAPEIDGVKEYNEMIDIFSYGGILCILSGYNPKVPFSGLVNNKKDLMESEITKIFQKRNLDGPFLKMVISCLNQTPSKREKISEIKMILEKLLFETKTTEKSYNWLDMTDYSTIGTQIQNDMKDSKESKGSNSSESSSNDSSIHKSASQKIEFTKNDSLKVFCEKIDLKDFIQIFQDEEYDLPTILEILNSGEDKLNQFLENDIKMKKGGQRKKFVTNLILLKKKIDE